MSHWFSVRLLYKNTVGSARDTDLVREESIRVFMADEEADAVEKANALGKHGEHEYANDAGELVRWIFVRVLEIQDLCEAELSDGTEVYSRLYRGADDEE